MYVCMYIWMDGWLDGSVCCTPYIMDSPSSINPRQQSWPEFTRVDPDPRDTITCNTTCVMDNSRYPTGLSANYCLTQFTCILFLSLEYFFFYLPFFVPRVFLLPASQHCYVLWKGHKITKTNMYLERKIKVMYYRKQVIQCHQCSYLLLTPQVENRCYIFIGRVHCVSKVGMIPQHYLSQSVYLSIYLPISICSSIYQSLSLSLSIYIYIYILTLGKIWIQSFSLQLWVNCRVD